MEERQFLESLVKYIPSSELKTTYSYYENGDLRQKNQKSITSSFPSSTIIEKDWKYEYRYDENGYLIMKKEIYTYTNSTENPVTKTQNTTQFSYTNDETGKPISAELIETKNGKNDYASQTLTFNYKTRYSYQAE